MQDRIGIERLRDWKGFALIDETRERHERRESHRAKIGYGHTAQFAALDRELQLISQLAADIREQLKTSTEDWIFALRNCNPDNLAWVTLDCLMTAIIRQQAGVKAWIRLGRAAQGEAWAAGLLIEDKSLHRRISRIDDSRKRAIAIKRAGYKSKEWSEEQAYRVGDWFIKRAVRVLRERDATKIGDGFKAGINTKRRRIQSHLISCTRATPHT
jgi:hypothetical protein